MKFYFFWIFKLDLTDLEAFAPAAVVNQHGLTAEEMATKRGFRRLGVYLSVINLYNEGNWTGCKRTRENSRFETCIERGK